MNWLFKLDYSIHVVFSYHLILSLTVSVQKPDQETKTIDMYKYNRRKKQQARQMPSLLATKYCVKFE